MKAILPYCNNESRIEKEETKEFVAYSKKTQLLSSSQNLLYVKLGYTLPDQ
jgi:hypothetical protein